MVAGLCHVVLSCFRGEKAKRCLAKTRQMVTFSCFAWRPFARHTKIRHFSCVAFSPPVCRIFAWRGERSPRENPPTYPLAGFRVATFRVFAPIRHFPWVEFSSTVCLAGRKVGKRNYENVIAFSSTVVSGGAKGRHAITREHHHLVFFFVATFSVFAPKTHLYDMTQIGHHSFL